MNKIYIDKTSKQTLINSILNHDKTPVDVILYKKNFKIYSLLKDTQLLPNVLVGIVNEYNNNIINVEVTPVEKFEMFDGKIVDNIISIKHNNELWFQCTLNIKFNPVRFKINTTNHILELYCHMNKSNDVLIFDECLNIFNDYMRLYYKKQQYIEGFYGNYYDSYNYNYHIENKCLMNKYHGSGAKLKNEKILKNVIVVMKILTNIIIKYHS